MLFPYLNGDELNNNSNQVAIRWVINFFDWPEEKCKQEYPDCYDILNQTVKPERQRWKKDEKGNDIIGEYALRKPLPEKWWIYADKRPALYRTIAPLDKTLVIARTSKTGAFVFVANGQVLNANLTVFAINGYELFSVLQSNIHINWAWKYTTRFKTDLIYQPTDIFEIFPFSQNISIFKKPLEHIGETYHEHRRELMLAMQVGLTKTYNLFHARLLRQVTLDEERLEDEKAFQKLHGKDAAHLRKHLAKTPSTIPFNEAVTGILKLRDLHVQMDNAVLEAYGWSDINLHHDFYEVEYLPENDRVRYTIHPDARREILKRLLELNHKIHEQEVVDGLWDKNANTNKNKSINKEIKFLKESQSRYGQLFDEL